MAGYILKIVIEDTHPPVWRRIMVPDHITFADLHNMIQIIFGWENDHLHEFTIPMDRIVIDGDEEGMMRGEHYQEEETLIDPFIRSYRWIRYTYDFGDNWRHKIQIEKTDETYEGRSALLLKAKGDNFEEDSGGIWDSENSYRCVFDQKATSEKLAAMIIPINPELEEVVLLKESMDQLRDLYGIVQNNFENLFLELENLAGGKQEKSLMEEKIRLWKTFAEERDGKLCIAKSQKNNRELLSALGKKETKDYCKYLQLRQESEESDEEKIRAISQSFSEHPEYLLYVFSEQEFTELKKWIKYPEGEVNEPFPDSDLITKTLALGLGDFQQRENVWNLSFASDIQELVSRIGGKEKKETYLLLERFDKRFGKLLCVYTVLELENLYKIYSRLYDKNIDKHDFFRMLYWHDRFNDFVHTVYKSDGTSYVSHKDIDVERVIRKEAEYAENLPYAFYSRKEIDRLSDDLSNRSDWMDILFTTLHYEIGLDAHDSQKIMIELAADIFSGKTLNELVDKLETEIETKWDIEVYCELWGVLTGLMLDLELPMLRGRSRKAYGREKNISPWTIDMVEDSDIRVYTKESHMYEFPQEIQECMEKASEYGSEEAIYQLMQYKEKKHVCSEEFLFLLAQSCITFCKISQAEQLIQELKKSSSAGKRVGKVLESHLHEAMEYNDEDLEMWNDGWKKNSGFLWDSDDTDVEKPYVREKPKIGRNDPCPCGSGKKYKKCCGR